MRKNLILPCAQNQNYEHVESKKDMESEKRMLMPLST